MGKLVFLLTASIILFCSIVIAGTTPFKLPSGKVIKLKSQGPWNFSTGENPALLLEYETDINLNEIKLLRGEVEEIWPFFRPDVEKEKKLTAIIKVSGPEYKTGTNTTKHISRHFILYMNKNGTWRVGNWIRDYEKEAEILYSRILSNFTKGNMMGVAKDMHYPSSFSNKQKSEEMRGLRATFLMFTKSFGRITNYKPNKSMVPINSFTVGSVSPEFWAKYPYFFGRIFDVKYSDDSTGAIIIRFSIIKNRMVTHSITFGFTKTDENATEKLKKFLAAMNNKA